MKKITTLILTLVLIFSLFAVNVNAEEVNFAKDAKWEKGSAVAFEEKNGICTATGINERYKFPYIDLLPSIKAALADNDEITIDIYVEIKAEFVEGEEGGSLTVRPLLRGNNATNLKGADNVDAWYEAYDEALDGEDRVFSNASGNIMKTFENIEVNDEDWTEYCITLELTAGQINTTAAINKWYLSVDNVTEYEMLKSLSFKNVRVIVPEEPEETPTPKPTPTPTAKPEVETTKAPEASKAPEVSKAPEASAPATETQAPDKAPDEAGNGTTAIVICAIICAAVIIGSVVGAIVLVKKKTADK